jgi:hypothetical protein
MEVQSETSVKTALWFSGVRFVDTPVRLFRVTLRLISPLQASQLDPWFAAEYDLQARLADRIVQICSEEGNFVIWSQGLSVRYGEDMKPYLGQGEDRALWAGGPVLSEL